MQVFTVDIKEPEFVFILTDYYGDIAPQEMLTVDTFQTVTPGVSMVQDVEEIRRLRLAAREALQG